MAFFAFALWTQETTVNRRGNRRTGR